MFEQLTASHFDPYLNQSFAVLLDDGVLDLELVQVTAQPLRPAQKLVAHGRELTIRPDPFNLRFQGPHQPALPQQMYTLSRPDLTLPDAIFLVPVGIDAAGRYYEAVF